jgi:hypothetical protein
MIFVIQLNNFFNKEIQKPYLLRKYKNNQTVVNQKFPLNIFIIIITKAKLICALIIHFNLLFCKERSKCNTTFVVKFKTLDGI